MKKIIKLVNNTVYNSQQLLMMAAKYYYSRCKVSISSTIQTNGSSRLCT